MGQQQLILLILAAIIVGVAIVAGLNMFGQNAAQANQEAVMQDILTIASRAQAWYRRPTQMGGGGRSFVGLSLANISFPSSNANGSYALSGNSATNVTITGTGVEDAGGTPGALQVQIAVGVDTISTAQITP